MAISFTPCLRKKLKSEKHGILNIRITTNRKSTYVSLKEKIPVRFWNENTHEIRTHKDFDPEERQRLNNLIETKITELKHAHKVSGDVDKTKNNARLSFIDYLNEELHELELRSKIGTYKRYKTTYFHLMGFLATKGKTDLLFPEINPILVRDFETYILAHKTIKGTLVKINTSKNYMKCFKRLYFLAIQMGVYTSFSADPFAKFVNKRLPIENKRLDRGQVQVLFQHHFEKTHPLFHTRNQFLFQIFCQGLRVSDLFTLRFENINRQASRIDFFQFKTKKLHSILINDSLLMLLKDYIKPDLTYILTEKHNVELITGKVEKLNYYEMCARFEDISREILKRSLDSQNKIGEKAADEILFEVEPIKAEFNRCFLRISHFLYTGLVQYAVKHPKDFIFPALKNVDFEDVIFNENTRLTKYQYNQLQSKEAMYNKSLKKLQAAFSISINLTSHISRHTYASMLFERDPKRLYEISKGLGHTNMKITEAYLKSFDADVVDQPNVEFFNTFNHLKQTQVLP